MTNCFMQNIHYTSQQERLLSKTKHQKLSEKINHLKQNRNALGIKLFKISLQNILISVVQIYNSFLMTNVHLLVVFSSLSISKFQQPCSSVKHFKFKTIIAFIMLSLLQLKFIQYIVYAHSLTSWALYTDPWLRQSFTKITEYILHVLFTIFFLLQNLKDTGK